MPERQLNDWLNAWMAYTETLPTTQRFRTWAGLGCIAGCLARRTFIKVFKGKIQYPNFYIILTGPPGSGKSIAIDTAWEDILRHVPLLKLVPQKITAEAFTQEMERSVETYVLADGTHDMSCSVTGFLSEFGVFVAAGDTRFMSLLANLYDNPSVWDYKTKQEGEDHIENPCFNMVGGATPFILRERFSLEALEQGLPARALLVYDDKQQHPEVALDFVDESLEEDEAHTAEREELRQKLIYDLEVITQLVGRFRWERDAGLAYADWARNLGEPQVKDPSFEHYNTRRMTAHFPKLCMAVSVSRSNNLIVTKEDFERAQSILLESETDMPKSLSMATTHDLSKAQKIVAKLVALEWKKNQKGLPEGDIRRLILREVHPRDVPILFNEMIAARVLNFAGEEPSRIFLPGPGIKALL